MKHTLPLAAAAFLLAACASTGGPTPSPRAAAGTGGTYYCWKDRLATEGDNLVCNWEGSVAAACTSTGIVSIARSDVARGPDNARRCENGQWLVMLTTK